MARRSTQKPKVTKDAAKAVDQVADQNTQGASDVEQSTEAHAAAPAQQTQGHPGGGDGAPEVPAGDQDNAETVTVAIIAGASEVKEPTDPTEPTEPTEPTRGFVLRIIGPKKGRWRIGRRFDRSPVDIPLDDLSEDEVAALDADDALSIEVVSAT